MSEFLASRDIKGMVLPENIRFSDLPIAGPGIGPLIGREDFQAIEEMKCDIEYMYIY